MKHECIRRYLATLEAAALHLDLAGPPYKDGMHSSNSSRELDVYDDGAALPLASGGREGNNQNSPRSLYDVPAEMTSFVPCISPFISKLIELVVSKRLIERTVVFLFRDKLDLSFFWFTNTKIIPRPPSHRVIASAPDRTVPEASRTLTLHNRGLCAPGALVHNKLNRHGFVCPINSDSRYDASRGCAGAWWA